MYRERDRDRGSGRRIGAGTRMGTGAEAGVGAGAGIGAEMSSMKIARLRQSNRVRR